MLIAPVGCDSSSPKSKPDPLHSYDGRVIRGWLLALERQDYEQAAYYFAPGALIDQGHPVPAEDAVSMRSRSTPRCPAAPS